jgi:hypothetical protein
MTARLFGRIVTSAGLRCGLCLLEKVPAAVQTLCSAPRRQPTLIIRAPPTLNIRYPH